MSLDPLTAGIDLVKTVADKFFPDAGQAQKDAFALELMRMQNDAAAIQGQLEINKIEAASGSMFVAGGRPAVIWVAVVALALAYWPKAIMLTAMWTVQAYAEAKLGHPLPVYPDLGVTDLLALLGSLLGIASLRSFDKFQGNATQSIAPRSKT